jgi:dihydrofolate reductase
MLISLIVATDVNGCIGKNNTIPWKQREDLIRFKNITTNHVVLMGSKTFDSIGKPLPNRLNIVITSNPDKYQHYDNVITFFNIEKAISFTQDRNEKELFVIGGGQIYKKFIELEIIDKIYLTVVFTAINNGDTYVNIPNLIKWNTIQDTIITESDDLNEFRTKFTIYSKN